MALHIGRWLGLGALSFAYACSSAGSSVLESRATADGGASRGASPSSPTTGSTTDEAPDGSMTPPSDAVGDGGSQATGSTTETDAGCGGAIVCEDFDDYPLGVPEAGATWSISAPDCSGTGVITVDDTESHSGMRSLKVAGAAGYCNHVFFGTPAVATLTGPVWARFYVRFTTALTTDHATFLAMHDANDAGDLRMGGQDSVLMWNRESDDATLPEMSPAGTALSVSPSVLAWHCVELEVDPSGPTLQTWLDGSLVAGLVVGSGASSDADGQWVRDTSWSPRLTDARFGWESYDSEAETLWFDDIAIGAARVGCGS